MTNRTFHSVFWTGLERFGMQIFQALFTIILARLLLPSDYGLIAMIFIFLMGGQIVIDAGLPIALMQKKNPTETDFSTVFWFNIMSGLFFYGIFFFCATPIADFYEQPLLNPIIKVAGLNFIAWSFGLVHATKLNINLGFKRQAFISITAVIISGGIGIILAYYGYGVWALVTQFLINNTLRSLFFWLFGIRWFPKFIFQFASLKSLLPVGFASIFAAFLDTIYKNIYAIFIGKRYSAAELGFFQQGNTLSSLVTAQITYAITTSFIPLQSKHHDYPDEQQKLFFRFLSLLCFLIFPLAILFLVLAEPFVSFILTEKWLPTVPLIQILCLSLLLYPISVINNRILLVKGLSKQLLTIESIKKAFGFMAFFICLPHGISWICASIGFYVLFSAILSIIYSQKILSIQWTEQLKIVFPILGLAVFSGIAAWCAMMGVKFYAPTNDFLKLLCGGISGIGIYVLGGHLLKFNEIRFALDYLKKKRP